MTYTITQQRALLALSQYTDAAEVREATLRLNAYSPQLSAEELRRDIHTIMAHDVGGHGSVRSGYRLLMDFIMLRGRRCNPVHAAAMHRACWSEWQAGWATLHGRYWQEDAHARRQVAKFVRGMRPKRVDNLAEILTNGDRGDDLDLDFFNALPEEFTVWSSISGYDIDATVRGMSFTTHRGLARWLECRDFGGRSLIRATVRKSDVFTVFAREHEVLVRPTWYEVVHHYDTEVCSYPADANWKGGPAVVIGEPVTSI